MRRIGLWDSPCVSNSSQHSPSTPTSYVLILIFFSCLYVSFISQLHTLEDFTAHSNFCEPALANNMDHHDVFVHVGDHVRLQAPNGKSVAPLVTGTFGSSDFIHRLLGEATDHIVSD